MSPSPPAARILDRLEGVRSNAADQYLAKCPAHADRSPSLSIRDIGDCVLIHCFAGCDAVEIMESMGLTLADLFDHQSEHKPVRAGERWDPRALLKLVRTEAHVVLLAARELTEGRALTEADHERLVKAAARIARIVELAA